MKISEKLFKCDKCGFESKMTTNHEGSFRGCKRCNNKRAILVCQTEAGIAKFNQRQEELAKHRANLPKSVLSIAKQEKSFRKMIGNMQTIECVIRWDDTCGNNHNSFAITGDIFTGTSWQTGGCIHEEIEKHFPEFKHLINWHHFTSDGYLYLSNITYHAKKNNLDSARSCANWEDATIEQLLDEEALKARLPKLMEQLKSDIEALGMVY